MSKLEQSPRLFVDFDATLFDYDRFHPWLITFLEEQHQMPTGRFQNILSEYYDNPASLHRLYDHRGHFKVATGMNWETIARLIIEELAHRPVDFMFSDAEPFLEEQSSEENIAILTFGVSEYQLFKVSLCPVIKRLQIPVFVVTEPKASYLGRPAYKNGGTLVDDKYPLGLPEQWQHVWLKRDMEETPLLLADGAVCINSLNQYKEARVFSAQY